MRGIVEVRIHGGENVPGYTGRPWSNSEGDLRVETVVSRHYYNTHF